MLVWVQAKKHIFAVPSARCSLCTLLHQFRVAHHIKSGSLGKRSVKEFVVRRLVGSSFAASVPAAGCMPGLNALAGVSWRALL
jgi:hypothetical protein